MVVVVVFMVSIEAAWWESSWLLATSMWSLWWWSPCAVGRSASEPSAAAEGGTDGWDTRANKAANVTWGGNIGMGTVVGTRVTGGAAGGR